jgi:hypothetical protein
MLSGFSEIVSYRSPQRRLEMYYRYIFDSNNKSQFEKNDVNKY